MEDITIKDLILNKYKESRLIIPAIQRKYVWKDKKICNFFESIMRGYPIGQMLIWNIEGKKVKQSSVTFYDFLGKYDEKSDIYNSEAEGISEDKEYYAILDGQQRIQSLIIGLAGSYTKARNKYQKELYINLSEYANANKNLDDEEIEENNEYSVNEEEENDDDYNYKYEFRFLTEEEADKSDNAWYKVKDILQKEDNASIRKELSKYEDKFKNEETKDIAKDILDKLSEVINRRKDILQIYNIEDDKFTTDEILEIFVRTNSGGEKLSKSDLLFSTVVEKWDKGRDTIDEFLKEINKKNEKLSFKFTNDFIMRTFLYILGAKEDKELTMKVEIFGDIANQVEENWKDISGAMRKTARVLRKKGISSASIKSHNAIIPIVYYFYNGGNDSKQDVEEIEKYIVVSQMSQIFGVDSNRALKNTRKALKNKKDFKLEYFKDEEFAGGKKLIPTEEDFKNWMNSKYGTQYATLLLRFLYPEMDKEKYQYEQDHIHSKSKIASLNNPKYNKMKDNIPNLQLLTSFDNEEKYETDLEEWCKKHGRPKYVSETTSLKVEDFEIFYEDRMKNIIKELKKKFNIK